MTIGDRGKTLLLLGGIVVASSALFALILPGGFPKVFGIALAIQVTAGVVGFGNSLFWHRVADLPHRDRAGLMRIGFHLVTALATGAWAWLIHREEFLETWFLAYLVIAAAGALGGVADLAGKFKEGYRAALDDLRSGRYPRV